MKICNLLIFNCVFLFGLQNFPLLKKIDFKKTLLEEKPLVVLIPSYNNQRWCIKNLESVFGQNYSNYRVIYINDCSDDYTMLMVKDIIKKYRQEYRCTLINNKKRCLALENIYNAIHTHCHNDEIVVALDGDDAFAHNNVLNIINEKYSKENIWLTHGSFACLSDGQKGGWCRPVPTEYIEANKFREWTDGPTHLRTYYSWLFKKINKDDLLDEDGDFYKMTSDVAILMPMIEMCGSRHSFIDEVLYIYNDLNDLNDHKQPDGSLQSELNIKIREKEKYRPL